MGKRNIRPKASQSQKSGGHASANSTAHISRNQTQVETKFQNLEKTKSKDKPAMPRRSNTLCNLLGYWPRASHDNCWAPSTYNAFKALLSARLCAAIWNIISDCDETFNYWEPTHFIIYGSGFQTWEYSPEFGIRSYAYILLHAIPGWIYSKILQSNKVLVFYFIRCLLAFTCAACEAYFYKGINHRMGAKVAQFTLAFLLFAPGMFNASAAYLPSSFSMYLTLLAMGAWFLKNYPIAIVSVATSTFVGWPFAGVLGVTIAYDIVVSENKMKLFLKWCVASTILVLGPVIAIDYYFFQKLIVAPLNIVLYNIFSPHGPDLYGVEPWTFYFLNGFLNFNVIFVAALLVLPILVLTIFALRHRNKKGLETSNAEFLWMTILPMYIWVLIFFTTPHKEERFLFPVYPLFCLSAAIAVVLTERLVLEFILRKWEKFISIATIIFTIFYALVAVSRIVALYRGYHAPFETYMEINRLALESKQMSSSQTVNLCVGKEWYRFPSSFFLPQNWQLQFIQSEFRGQLPKPYEKTRNATSIIPTHMNGINAEEPSRYINIEHCHFLVDCDFPNEKPREPRYLLHTDQWETISTAQFLDASRSPTLWRAFYIPWLSDRYCSYAEYSLLKSKTIKLKLL